MKGGTNARFMNPLTLEDYEEPQRPHHRDQAREHRRHRGNYAVTGRGGASQNPSAPVVSLLILNLMHGLTTQRKSPLLPRRLVLSPLRLRKLLGVLARCSATSATSPSYSRGTGNGIWSRIIRVRRRTLLVRTVGTPIRSTYCNPPPPRNLGDFCTFIHYRCWVA